MSAIPGLRGYYINLDRAEDRRRQIEAEIEKHGLGGTYRRFPAVDGRASPNIAGGRALTPGELAIFRSHLGVLKDAAGTGDYVHVLEDDSVLSAQLRPYLGFALKLGLFSVYDIVFLEMAVAPDFLVLDAFAESAAKAFRKAPGGAVPSDFALIDVEQTYYLGASSYVVGPHAIDRVISLCETEYETGPRLAIDILFRREMRAGRLRGGGVLPFLTSLAEESLATQSGRPDRMDRVAATTLFRQSFFIDRDMAALDRAASEAFARSKAMPRNPQVDLLAKLAHSFGAGGAV